MRRLTPADLLKDLRIWLIGVPQGVRRDFSVKRQETRDAAVHRIAELLVERMAKHEVHSPDPISDHWSAHTNDMRSHGRDE